MNKKDAITIIRSILTSTKDNISTSRLNAEFKSETGVDIPLFGYQNLSDFLHSLNNTVKLTGIYPIEKISLIQNDKSGHIVSLVNRQKNPQHQRKHLPKCRLAKHSRSNSKFDKRFDEKNGKDKELAAPPAERKEEPAEPQMEIKKKGGFLEQIKRNAARRFPENKIDTNVKKLYTSRKSDVPSHFMLKIDSPSIPAPFQKKKICGLHNFLDNFVPPGQSIPFIDVKFYTEEKSCIDISVCKINSPHQFYFHLGNFQPQFKKLISSMQQFYTSEFGLPDMPAHVIKQGQICAVFHREINNDRFMWFRGEIQGPGVGLEIIVTLVDYGKTVEVCKENLKYLLCDFVELPRQALLGSLGKIRPKGQDFWPRKATDRFSELVFEKEFVAEVLSVDYRELRLSLTLSSSKGIEKEINDTLVKEGYADYRKIRGLKCCGSSFPNSEFSNINPNIRLALKSERAEGKGNKAESVRGESPISENCTESFRGRNFRRVSSRKKIFKKDSSKKEGSKAENFWGENNRGENYRAQNFRRGSFGGRNSRGGNFREKNFGRESPTSENSWEKDCTIESSIPNNYWEKGFSLESPELEDFKEEDISGGSFITENLLERCFRRESPRQENVWGESAEGESPTEQSVWGEGFGLENFKGGNSRRENIEGKYLRAAHDAEEDNFARNRRNQRFFFYSNFPLKNEKLLNLFSD